MIFIYRCFIKLLDLFINIIFVVQIVLMVTIFLTASYWFFHLINVNLFDFAEPLAGWISEFVKSIYKKEVVLSETGLDGTLLFFDVIGLIFTFLITVVKGYTYKLVEKIELAIVIKRKKYEQKMNEKLEAEAIEFIKNYKKSAIVVEFETKDKAEYQISEDCYQYIQPGDIGFITIQGTRFIGFELDV